MQWMDRVRLIPAGDLVLLCVGRLDVSNCGQKKTPFTFAKRTTTKTPFHAMIFRKERTSLPSVNTRKGSSCLGVQDLSFSLILWTAWLRSTQFVIGHFVIASERSLPGTNPNTCTVNIYIYGQGVESAHLPFPQPKTSSLPFWTLVISVF